VSGRRALGRFGVEAATSTVTAVRGIAANRMRAFLSMIGIAIGVATLTTIYGLVSGLTTQFTSQVSALGSNTMYVTRRPWVIRGDWWEYRNRPPITRSDVAALRRGAAHLAAIAPVASAAAEVSYRDERVGGVQVRGTTSEFLEISTLKLERGRSLSAVESARDSQVAIIGSEVAERLFPDGSPLGERILLGPHRFTVIGVLAPQGKSFGRSQDSVVIIPIEAFGRIYGMQRDMLIVASAEPGHLHEAEDEIVDVLRRSRSLPPETANTFSVNRQSELLKMFEQETAALFGVAIVIGLITLLVGGIGVMNIMLVAVTERTREIGVRRALGARRRTILMQFLVESALVTMIGGSIGTLLGVVTSSIIDQIAPIHAELTTSAIVASIVFSAAIGLAFGTWPASRAARLDPIESLRFE